MLYSKSIFYVIILGFVYMVVGCGKQSGLNHVLAPGTKPVKLNKDSLFVFTEGPACDSAGTLFFTDGPTGKIWRVDDENKFTVIITGAGRPDGQMFDHQGNLVVCEYDAKKVSYWSPDGKLIKVLADEYNKKGLNGPNDVVIDRKGGIYFSDPFFKRPNAPQEVEGIYYIPQGGTIQRVVSDDSTSPNGVILTPDEKILLAVDNFLPYVFAYDVNSDGTVSNGRIWGLLTLPTAKLGSDKRPNVSAIGVCMDTEGHLYVGTNTGIQVFDSQGKNLGTIALPERPMNMTYGRKNPYLMYIATGNSMYSLEMKVKGICFPQLQ